VSVDGNDDEESDGCLEWMRLERERKSFNNSYWGESFI